MINKCDVTIERYWIVNKRVVKEEATVPLMPNRGLMFVCRFKMQCLGASSAAF